MAGEDARRRASPRLRVPRTGPAHDARGARGRRRNSRRRFWRKKAKSARFESREEQTRDEAREVRSVVPRVEFFFDRRRGIPCFFSRLSALLARVPSFRATSRPSSTFLFYEKLAFSRQKKRPLGFACHFPVRRAHARDHRSLTSPVRASWPRLTAPLSGSTSARRTPASASGSTTGTYPARSRLSLGSRRSKKGAIPPPRDRVANAPRSTHSKRLAPVTRPKPSRAMSFEASPRSARGIRRRRRRRGASADATTADDRGKKSAPRRLERWNSRDAFGNSTVDVAFDVRETGIPVSKKRKRDSCVACDATGGWFFFRDVHSRDARRRSATDDSSSRDTLRETRRFSLSSTAASRSSPTTWARARRLRTSRLPIPSASSATPRRTKPR